MHRLLADRAGVTAWSQSVLETRVLRVLREAGLPDPVPQQEIHDAGRLIAIPDFASPHVQIGKPPARTTARAGR